MLGSCGSAADCPAWIDGLISSCYFSLPPLQRFKCSVYRRYNDFVVFHEMLLQKFPYRMVPALPPKRMLGGNLGLCFVV